MSRAFLFVLDSFGIGGARDADRFGDLGSNTLLHIAEQCAHGGGDRQDLRSGPLDLPHMARMGLAEAAKLACGTRPPLAGDKEKVTGRWGVGEEISNGKDTPSGHWEIAGVPVRFDWGYFQGGEEAFPPELVEQIVASGDISGILGNCHASGTEIIRQLGEEHIRTGKPICYTSSDSVFQIAAHETMFGLERLYELCLEVRALVDPLNIGRVIARPFTGASSQTFKRTSNRRDYSVPPPSPTLLDRLTEAGRQVIAVGKISDIFAHRGISRSIKADGNMALADATLTAMDEAEDGDLVFTNFVDFDMLFGHRRDAAGYAAALEAFDARIPELLDRMREDDLMILTADHGCDPTWRGTDHTRERVPILVAGPGIVAGSIGLRTSFADIGATIAGHLGLAPGEEGKAFLD